MNARNVGIVFFLLLLIGGGFYLGQKYKVVPQVATPVVTPIVTPTDETIITTTPGTTVDMEAVVLAVRTALVVEHGPDANSLNVTVSKVLGNYAQGGASGSGGGGMWFAAKVNSVWKLAWDGNGTISCAAIDPYGFPVSMIPECWNDATQKSVTR